MKISQPCALKLSCRSNGSKYNGEYKNMVGIECTWIKLDRSRGKMWNRLFDWVVDRFVKP